MATGSPAEKVASTLNGDECRQLVADALAQMISREIEGTVVAKAHELGQADWYPFQTPRGPSQMWVAPFEISFQVDGARESAFVHWPMPWGGVSGSLPGAARDSEPVQPGRHAGFYIGGPQAVGQGVRLKPGLHTIPRPTPSGGWRLDCVVSSLLGRDVFGAADSQTTWTNLSWAVLGKLPGRYIDDDLKVRMLATLGLPPDVREREVIRDRLVRSVQPTGQDERDALSAPRRTAASRSRLFGGDEVMAELVYARMLRQVARTSAQTDGVGAWLADVTRRVSRSAAAAMAALASGQANVVSVVTRAEEGMTLARVEQAARTSFLGFRGIGKVRGRSDLRDLEPGWRGILCPVQTPESKDTGLIRYATVGTRDDAPDELSEWFDLSASAALIPFINHDDPARASIGSKNLKQAVPVDRREPPLVATGWERVLGTADGTARAPMAGKVTELAPGFITIETRRGFARVAMGAPWVRRSQVDNQWFVDVEVGESVRAGQILAHAPDVTVVNEAKTEAELSLGVNALVALTPWHGLNYEDGIVVSESLAARLGSSHLVRIDERRAPEDSVVWLITPLADEPVNVDVGDALLLVTRRNGRTDTVCSPIAGELLEAFLDNARGTVSLILRVHSPLAVGDKLSNRHQGKGVVSAILPDEHMPRLPNAQLGGRRVEMILNPVGVLRRLNVGQLWEMHLGLEALLTDGLQRRVGRVMDAPEELQQRLALLGAPRGRLPLLLPDGSLLGGDAGVVVGPQYIVKLNHLASSKLSVRGAQASVSPVTAQPSRGRRFRHDQWVGGAQHLGEMEVWALEAAGATAVLADAFNARSARRQWEKGKPRASLRSVQAHLAVGGLDLVINDSGPRALQGLAASEVLALTPVWRDAAYPVLPSWEELAKEERPAPPLDLATLIAAFGDDRDLSETPVYTGGDPLYRRDVHGLAGSPEAEEVRYSFQLPRAMRHPWTTKSGPELPALLSVPVLPPAFRVATPIRRGLDREYQRLASLLVEYDRVAATGAEDELKRLWKRIRECVTAIFLTDPDSIAARLNGKRGLLCRYLLGQSVTYSGRAVIVPDLSLEPDEVGLPEALAKGLGINGLDSDDGVVIVNRQPSLHPYSLVALQARLVSGDAIHLHPLCLGGLAGDFDGDTVAVHRPHSHEARRAAWETLSPAARIRSSTNGSVLAKMDLDIALGLYLASCRSGGAAVPPLTLDAVPLDASRLFEAVSDLVLATKNPPEALKALDAVERAGFDGAVGWSIGALDLLVDGEGGRLAEAIAAGVAGGERAVKQLLTARGKPNEHSGHPNSVVPDVKGCYLTGLSVDDYFHTSPVALAELAHKKLTTPRAGQLTKELVALADSVVVSRADCGVVSDRRSPLTCVAGNGICQQCYGVDPGQGIAPSIGSRVGLLAATVIGERSTQEAMKAFQAGGGRSDALGNALVDLYAVFGLGRSAALDFTGAGESTSRPKHLKLGDFLASAGDLTDGTNVAKALQPLVDLADGKLGGKVAPVHIQVLLKQLVDAFVLQHPAPIHDYTGQKTILLEREANTFQVTQPMSSEILPTLAPFIERVTEMLDAWAPRADLRPPVSVRLKHLSSSWGSTRWETKSITLNLKLAERDPRLLELVIVSQLAHLAGKGGSARDPQWKARMNRHLPGWGLRDLELNGDLARFAQQGGRSVFETATNRGNLEMLLHSGEVGIGGLRTLLVAGGLS